MGAGGIPNRGVEISFERSLKDKHKPNSRVDRYNKNGQLLQSRWYNDEGKAERNRDYSHSGNVPFPHDHEWTWDNDNGTRGTEHLAPDYERYN